MPAKKIDSKVANTPKPKPVLIKESAEDRITDLEARLKKLEGDFARLVHSHGFVF